MDLAQARALFPIVGKRRYLNNAGVAPTSVPVREAVCAWVDDVMAHGLGHESGWEERAERTRAAAARLLDVGPDEIAFVRNTSHGLALVAEGLDWRPGDEVCVCTEVEYPSNVYPWLHLADRGVKVREVRAVRGGVTAEAVADAMSPRTRLVSASAVQYATGHRTDLDALGRLCAERGALLCVDGIQQVGAAALHPKRAGVHFLSADSHKWMLGLSGIGILFVDRAVQARLRPMLVGWKSTTGAFDFDRAVFDLRRDAAVLEEGSPAYALVYGLGAALELLLEVGLPRVEAHIAALVGRLEAAARDAGFEVGPAAAERAGILTLAPPGAPAGGAERLAARCAAAGIDVSVRRGRLRVSPHLYNDERDIDALMAAICE